MTSMAPSPCFPSSNCILGSSSGGGRSWTQQENKRFENALALVDIRTAEGWNAVAEMTGRSVRDVMTRYRVLEIDVGKIESGDFPFVGYQPPSSSFTLDWEGDDGTRQAHCVGGPKRPGGRLTDQERKKGIPWTEEEHKLFLLGLNKYGKGDWRNISRNYVFTRTPTQVASHAQKYFLRLNSAVKDKRRASIHDITTVNLPENNNPPTSPSQTSGLTAGPNSGKANRSEAALISPSKHNDWSMHLPYSPFGMKFESQNSSRGGLHESMVGRRPMFS